MSTRDFLFEIGTEELPPKALSSLSAALEQNITAGLQRATLEFDASRRYATPRRLAVMVNGLQDQQSDKSIERLGPAVKEAFDGEGNPTKAALGFARSCGVELADLGRLEKDGVEKLAFSSTEQGRPSTDLLPDIVRAALAQLPIPKQMRWGSSRIEFVRPVHWAVMILGKETITTSVLGIESSNFSFGHRFHYNKAIQIDDAANYEKLLEETGGIIPDFDKRKELIRQLVTEEGNRAQATAVIDESLLDEVTGLVEYPVALTGHFEEHFLEVPAEALILTMKAHQKCFYVTDENDCLLPRFITVSNIVSKDPSQVVQGNERVIRPRLADARFFYETDKQRTLQSRTGRLKNIVFQEKLGSVYDKSERVAVLAANIAKQIGGDPTLCSRAARLSKCDLLTKMVGEFAELQGLMGYYYALHEGEPEELANALHEQYKPRFAGDGLPETTTGTTLALADKLDSMVGIFGIGESPTGSKDPFALRRAAIGILRIIVENKLDLNILECIELAESGFVDIDLQPSTSGEVFEFVLDRFKSWYLEEGVSSEVFQSVFVLKPQRPLDFHKRIVAVHNFNSLPESAALAAANKRVSNLLAKQDPAIQHLVVNQDLLQDPAEILLFDELQAKVLEVAPMFENGSYKDGLQSLASLKTSVDTFFDEVLVMCEDKSLQANRLALLQQLRNLFLQSADISYLHNN
ncbi:MAG: glycine--tRNA ligase subunit beta [Gammaproteobacteria bacterium]|nr:glycine--tRNA ligase subunit beta [Gammaproteobacteria bacterium]